MSDSPSASPSPVRYEERDSIAILTLDRPDRHNSINGKMAEELPLAWRAIIEDPDSTIVVLPGDTARVSSAGHVIIGDWKPTGSSTR